MPSLMDAIKGNLSSVTSTPSGGGEETSQVHQLMQAKTGLAVDDTSSPRASSLGEAAAAQTAAGQAQQTANMGAGVAAKLGGEAAKQEAEYQSQSAQVSQAREAEKKRYTDQAAGILQELTQGQKQLDVDRDRAKAEQVGILARLSDDKYVTGLMQAGQQARLDNQLGFDEALQSTIFGDDEALLKQQLGNADILNMDKNKFAEALQSISLDFAMKMAGVDITTANQMATAQGAGQIATGAAKGYAESEKQNKGDTTTKE